MTKIDEILDTVRNLNHAEYVELRQAMDSMDEAEWEVEQTRAAKQWQNSGLTDDDIDAAVFRRRHESRS
jgi:hypothetical protein